ncbi:hypothetical protein P153DRAFT_148179 [Dothidotthia symphoricarpi CBS 119687]|uniref:Uncharacterized protein n=1 Tax=Dothidotthia symphoricarpi CBS 119687 TaxID=1392245 RepID=A0A6A5ZXG3_9PLEO|nr:uncharacterized protein P153DRAFT_148179 [Dothidotthia symphoricarpi CBS 119687]KAF2123604.1 hypothetical protein P153DRAFT_148179 [Dothidotthia symphoricarpi CBS 119687]
MLACGGAEKGAPVQSSEMSRSSSRHALGQKAEAGFVFEACIKPAQTRRSARVLSDSLVAHDDPHWLTTSRLLGYSRSQCSAPRYTLGNGDKIAPSSHGWETYRWCCWQLPAYGGNGCKDFPRWLATTTMRFPSTLTGSENARRRYIIAFELYHGTLRGILRADPSGHTSPAVSKHDYPLMIRATFLTVPALMERAYVDYLLAIITEHRD